MTPEELVYEIEEIWRDDWFGALARERIARTAALIPADVTTLLDVGCGNGLFLKHLVERCRDRFGLLCALDRSRTALRHVPAGPVQCRAESLACRDRAFDLVSCLEVIEHLPVKVYRRALAEISRAARKYVLVSVPFEERIDSNACECPSCLTRFNPDYHMRSFDDPRLGELLAEFGFRRRETVPIGGYSEYRLPARLARLREFLRRRAQCRTFPAFTICPMCGYEENEKLRGQPGPVVERGPAVPSALRRVRHALMGWWPRREKHLWVACLYSRIG